jgi:hypothetical protein
MRAATQQICGYQSRDIRDIQGHLSRIGWCADAPAGCDVNRRIAICSESRKLWGLRTRTLSLREREAI